jgi:aspartate/methionine/tyrosine aminotransferase
MSSTTTPPSTPTPRSKLPDVGTTIFSVIGDLAARHEALNLSQGAPNFDCDPRLVEAAVAARRSGHNQYAPMPGLPGLRAAIAGTSERLTGAVYRPEDEVTVVGSASQGI